MRVVAQAHVLGLLPGVVADFPDDHAEARALLGTKLIEIPSPQDRSPAKTDGSNWHTPHQE